MNIRPAVAADLARVSHLWLQFQREHNRKHQRNVRETRANCDRVERHMAELVPLGQVLVLEEDQVLAQ